MYYFKSWIKGPIVDTSFRSSSLVNSFFYSVSFFLILRLVEFPLCVLASEEANRIGIFYFFWQVIPLYRWISQLNYFCVVKVKYKQINSTVKLFLCCEGKIQTCAWFRRRILKRLNQRWRDLLLELWPR